MFTSIVRSTVIAACLALVPHTAFAQETKIDADLQGVWRIVRWQEQDIEQLPEQLHKSMLAQRVIVEKDQMVWTSGKDFQPKKIRVGVDKGVKTIDFVFSNKRVTFEDPIPLYQHTYSDSDPSLFRLSGIYKIEGDRLTIAVIDRHDAKVRPTDFRVRIEPPTLVFTLVRVK